MRNKRYPIAAPCLLILAMLACNMPGGQSVQEQALAATITAQAAELQATNATTALPSNTPAPGDTAVPTNPPPTNPPAPANTPLPAAPSKPKNFKTQGSATGITFTWNDDSTNEGGFRIYQEGVTAPVVSVNANTGTGGMSSSLTGLACGFKSTFYIRAFNNAGESSSSNSEKGVTVPCTPSSLTANGHENTISFNWGVGTNHNEDGFHIYQQGVSQPVASRGPNGGGGGTNYDLSGQPCDLVATYSVTAFNSAGESGPSNLVQQETVPCGPFGMTITNITKDVVNYSWTDNGTSETGFHLYIDDVLFATLPPHPGTGTVSNDAPVQCDFNFPENHVYSITAFNYAGDSTTSEHVGATTPTC